MNNFISTPLILDGIHAIKYGQKRPKGNALRRVCYPKRYPKIFKNFNGLIAKGNEVTGVTLFSLIHACACVCVRKHAVTPLPCYLYINYLIKSYI